MTGTLESTLDLFVSEETFEVDDDMVSQERELKDVSRSCEPLRTYSRP